MSAVRVHVIRGALSHDDFVSGVDCFGEMFADVPVPQIFERNRRAGEMDERVHQRAVVLSWM